MSFCDVYGDSHIYEYKGGQHVCSCGRVMKMDDYNKTWSEK